MGDGSIWAGHGAAPGQVAEIIVTLDGETKRRGSGYRVGPGAVLTTAHVVESAASVRVRFDADLPSEWTAEVISCWTDPRSDLAVLTIAPREGEPPVTVARFGRIGGDRAAVLAVRAVGFPRFKLKTDDGDRSVYRDSHQADGSVAVLSNRREGTLEVTVPPPERDPDPEASPWAGMSGAAVWVGDRIVGVIAKHHRSDGLGRLAAARLDLALDRLDRGRRAELRVLLNLPEMLPDVVPPSAGKWVATAYQAQVRDIAPERLLDREAELDELAGFCAGDQPYAWWQAAPWAGKSALMAWFVLHPPAGVDVVSFFVTARLAGQSDSDACIDALIEQLAAFVGKSPASLLTVSARRVTMLGLLDDAASRLRETGRRLLLVIDGLDEDSGTITGPSIAALLPRRPPPEVRVLVTSRPDPPIRDDVAGDHPLRTIRPRQLDVSEHARDVERRAKLELNQLLAGDQLQQDVLGLITAAGGGLTLGDLEELTEQPPYEIEGLLGGIFGRTVGSRTAAPASERPGERVYLFTHETLRLAAEQRFGKSLAPYRDLVHRWADTYRQRIWPTDTPHYLLRSYPRLLISTGNLAQLVACATDQARHNRMRSVTGGDTLAFTEVSNAQQLLLALPDKDLTSLALLSVQRDHLTERNREVPTNLPAVWAMLGQPTRAEALANSIPAPDRRVEALAYLVKAAAIDGDCDRAARLADNAEALTSQITNAISREEAFIRFAELAAGDGTRDRVARLADETEAVLSSVSAEQRLKMLGRLAKVLACNGDRDRVTRLAGEAMALIERIDRGEVFFGHKIAPGYVFFEPEDEECNNYWDYKVLAPLIEVVADVGNPDQAEEIAARITSQSDRAEAFARLAAVLSGRHYRQRAARLADKAETLAAQITDPNWQAGEFVRLAEMVADGTDDVRAARLIDKAEVLAAGMTKSSWFVTDRRADVFSRLAWVVADRGHRDRAARLAEKAEALAAQITDPDQRAEEMVLLTEAVAGAKDDNRAARLIEEAEAAVAQMSNEYRQARALARLARVVAGQGHHNRAEALIAQITHPEQGVLARIGLAEVITGEGDRDRAARLANEAEAVIGQHEWNMWAEEFGQHERNRWYESSLARLAEVVAGIGNHDRAETLVAKITDFPDLRPGALARLARVVALGRDTDRAARLADEAEALIATSASPDVRALNLAQLAAAVASGGDIDRAARLADEVEALLGQSTHSYFRQEVLALLPEVAVAGGDHDRAAEFIAQIVDPDQRAQALVRLAITLVKMSEKTSPVRGHPDSASPMVLRARHLLAEAFVTSSWVHGVTELSRVDPLAVRILADELKARWRLDVPSDSQRAETAGAGGG